MRYRGEMNIVKNQQKMFKIKNTTKEMNTFDGLISTLDTTEERLPILRISQQQLLKMKSKENKQWGKKKRKKF